MIDSHCHLQDLRLNCCINSIVKRSEQLGVTHISSCACNEQEWLLLKQICMVHSKEKLLIVPSFGIHPWYANSISSSYLHQLRQLLQEHPHAGLGEIGLCKSSKGQLIPIKQQEQVFLEQMQLAVELSRAVTIHCVGYYNRIYELLKMVEKLPKRIVLHSYGSSFNMMTQLFNLVAKRSKNECKLYFSFSAKQLCNAGKKVIECCKRIPLHQLLLETDAPDQLPIQITDFDRDAYITTDPLLMYNEPAVVLLALKQAASIRNCSPCELEKQLTVNFAECFC